MRNPFRALSAFLSQPAPSGPLKFYLVSEQNIPSGSYINTPAYPKLGYIAAQPDLIITRLTAINPPKPADPSLVANPKGRSYSIIAPDYTPPSVVIQLTPEDAQNLAALTAKALHQRLYITLGETPLIAPKIMSPIESDAFEIGFSNMAEARSAERALQTLVGRS